MAKKNLSAAYNNTAMEDVTKRSLGLAFTDDDDPKDKAPEPETVKEEASVIKLEEKKVEEPTQKVAPKPEEAPKKVITRKREKKLTRPVSLIMDPVLYERLERASEETQRSINNYIALAVKNQLDKDGY